MLEARSATTQQRAAEHPSSFAMQWRETQWKLRTMNEIPQRGDDLRSAKEAKTHLLST